MAQWGEADFANVGWETRQSLNPANHRTNEADASAPADRAEPASGLLPSAAGREPFATESRGLPNIYLAFSPAHKPSPDSPRGVEEGGMSVRGGMGGARAEGVGAAVDLGQTLVKIETPRLFWAVFDEMIYDAGICVRVLRRGELNPKP